MRRIERAADLVSDKRNANKGTMRGVAMVEESFERNGAGRSVLADKNGKLIAGNKSAAAFVETGGDDIIVVQTDGTKLVVVQRTDLDLDNDSDTRARELAYADNRTAQIGLDWDSVVLDEDRKNKNLDLSYMFRADEIGDIVNAKPLFGGDGEPDDEDRGLGDRHGDRPDGSVELVVILNSESEAKIARREIQQMGYYVK
jgi:hypothetical protein